ncbi:5856_t:CDS:2 [Entrophospora sp. SA101]|nr:5856_t:CDS:2 [Entrophospora sp. SA101]
MSYLYSFFSLTSNATSAEIKKAYHKLALQYHPDKHTTSSEEICAEATRKFQALGFAYEILSDPKKRERYDKTGETDNSLEGLEDLGKEGWDAYFKELWSGSEEEHDDLIEAYKKFKGDMDLIMSDVLCATIDDEPRFCNIIKEAVASNEIILYEKFTESTNKTATKRRKKEANKEAKEAKKYAKELGLNQNLLGTKEGEDELQQLIIKKYEKRSSSFLDQLEAKYCNESNNKNKKIKKKKH